MSIFTQSVPQTQGANSPSFHEVVESTYIDFMVKDLSERDFFAFMGEDKLEVLAKAVTQEVSCNFFVVDFATTNKPVIAYADECKAIEFIQSLSFRMV
jgi:hypothetical protein